MKITSAENIQASEKEFIDFINAELDWSAIEEMILEKHKLQLQDEVIYKKGDILVYDEQIAYKLDFDIKVSLSLIFNRHGDCLDIKTPDGEALQEDNDGDKTAGDNELNLKSGISASGSDKEYVRGDSDWSNMASNIAEMIHDINQDT
ncbi:MAG: hypothetical protein HQK62_04150 [Desulfamplus sp.]|nr:hypothetical protein [Desulfamplus sp.]